MTAGIYFKNKMYLFFFFCSFNSTCDNTHHYNSSSRSRVHHLQEERKVRQMNSIYGTMMADKIVAQNRGTKSWHKIVTSSI